MTLRHPASLLALLAAVAAPPLALGGESGSGARVENEYKLSVPDAELEAVRSYLRERYGAGPDSLLPELGEGFAARFSDERFVDQYFDTPDLDLLRAECGVRRRQRWNLDDPAGDVKHGRELVQLKLHRPDDAELLNRTEVKFKVDPPRPAKGALDRHPLLGLVDRDDRPPLAQALERYGVDARRLQPLLTIEQRRWRVYLSRRGAPFATLTLDEVASRWFAWTVAFVEVEIELNEVAYTEADPAQRGDMEAISQRLADDLLRAFPSIEQNQTPKYNKVFAGFAAQVSGFESLVPHREALTVALIVGSLALLGAAAAGARRLRARRARRALTDARLTSG